MKKSSGGYSEVLGAVIDTFVNLNHETMYEIKLDNQLTIVCGKSCFEELRFGHEIYGGEDG